ncbi:MAG: universal stress protein [Reyranella sp.]|jgi:nucleotide-binding universal stress UspA family protein|nr:universal stress protein [Reyranella sp.]
MTYKTILVDCDASEKVGHRLAVAVQLAKRHGAHLIGAHVRAPITPPVFSDGTVPAESVLDAFEAAAKSEEAAASSAFTAAIKSAGLSTEWCVAEGYADAVLGERARYADLLVLGQTDPDAATRSPPALPESVVLASGKPAIVVPHVGARSEPGKTIMLCWNGSRESARAASDALPFLKQAEKVIVFVVKHAPQDLSTEADVKTWLGRHGVEAIIQHDVATDADVGGLILSRAADQSVDLIVMGLYGHSRLREMVLGGASRSLLASMTVPVLMAH